MKQIKFRMTGVGPLMLNNPQTANPMNKFAKALKTLTSKRQKTDEDYEEIFHLHFLASCYVSPEGKYVIPANMIARSFEEGAKERKLGTKFRQSVFVRRDMLLIFEHNGLSPEELWKDHADKYVDIRQVGVQKSLVPTSRMIVPEWSLEGELEFDENQLNKSEVWTAMVAAGEHKGIGTYRSIYGRYEVEEIK